MVPAGLKHPACHSERFNIGVVYHAFLVFLFLSCDNYSACSWAVIDLCEFLFQVTPYFNIVGSF